MGGIFASISALAMFYVGGYAENYFKKTIVDDCKKLDESLTNSGIDVLDEQLKKKVSWSNLFTLANENDQNKEKIARLEQEIAALKKLQ